MPYLIDGYNFLFRLEGFTESSLEKKRESFLAALNEKLASFKSPVSIVFDSAEQIQPYPQAIPLKNLSILFAPKGQSADAYIVELVETYKNPKSLTVVTSDIGLAHRCQHLHAKTVSIENFIALLIKRKKKKTDEKPPYSESRTELQRLLEEFEKRLKRD